MKLRWWIVGTIAVVAGGVLVLKHFADNKDRFLHFADNENEKNFGGFPPEIHESEFDGADFLT